VGKKESPIDPIEEEVTAFFESMLVKVENTNESWILLDSTANAIAAFIDLRFDRINKIGVARSFCRSIVNSVDLFIKNEK
jgi:hypothetical protein